MQTQPGGHGVDLDLVVAGGNGHATPGVGDGASRDCIINRFPVVRIFGSGPGAVPYQARYSFFICCTKFRHFLMYV